MAISSLKSLVLLTILVLIHTALQHPSNLAEAQVDHAGIQLMTEALDMDWPSSTTANSLYQDEDEDEEGLDLEGGGMIDRRSLYWRGARHYYISYGALSANRIPCPARSGRSYYTHNCYRAGGPAHPYSRGCSAITRCRS